MPHPYLVPVRPMLSRRTQSSGVSGSTSTVSDLPLTFRVNCMSVSFRQQRGSCAPRDTLPRCLSTHQLYYSQVQITPTLGGKFLGRRASEPRAYGGING